MVSCLQSTLGGVAIIAAFFLLPEIIHHVRKENLVELSRAKKGKSALEHDESLENCEVVPISQSHYCWSRRVFAYMEYVFSPHTYSLCPKSSLRSFIADSIWVVLSRTWMWILRRDYLWRTLGRYYCQQMDGYPVLVDTADYVQSTVFALFRRLHDNSPEHPIFRHVTEGETVPTRPGISNACCSEDQ